MSDELRGPLAALADALSTTCPKCCAQRLAECRCYHPNSKLYDDQEYLEWLHRVGAALAHGAARRPSHTEEQWAERAVFDGWFKWAESDPSLVLADRGAPPLPPATVTTTPFDTWLASVTTFLLRGEPEYPVSPAERAFADQAVRARRLIYSEQGDALCLPSNLRPDPPRGPYR